MFGYCRAAQGSNDHKSDLQGGRATYLKVWLYLGEKKNTETRERERERGYRDDQEEGKAGSS